MAIDWTWGCCNSVQPFWGTALGQEHLSLPSDFRGPPGDPRGLPCLYMLLFPLHAQTPSPPRCARRDRGRPRASQATPGSPLPLHSVGGTVTPTGNGLDLQTVRKKESSFSLIGHCRIVTRFFLYNKLGSEASVPLNGDSSTGAGLRARNSFLAYLLRAPLFSVGTMSWRMKRARSRMS